MHSDIIIQRGVGKMKRFEIIYDYYDEEFGISTLTKNCKNSPIFYRRGMNC